MNTPRDFLTGVLHGWRVTPPPDAEFRRNVWRRIERQQGVTWPAYLRSHATAWSLTAVVMLGVAVYGGNTLAQARVRADREALVVTYLVDLDPRVQAVLKH